MANKVIDPAPIIKNLADRCLEAKGIECSTLGNLIDMLHAAPGLDAVEVVHGRWIKYKDEKFMGYDADGRIKYRNVYSYNCDKCGHGTAVKSNYCPACGAKMEGVKEVGY